MTQRDLLARAYQALYAVELVTGRTLCELVGDSEVYEEGRNLEDLAELMFDLQTEVEG